MKKELRANFYLCLACVFATLSLSATESESSDFFVGITCPGDKWVDCDAELWTLYQYGDAYFKTYDGTFKLPEPKEDWYLNECNTGYITRTWKHYAYGKWYECTQTIHVGHGSDGADIYWPKEDLVLEGCNPNLSPDNFPAYYDRPHYNEGTCDMMVESYKDQIFSFGGGCKKIIRKWTVINWCEYVPNSYPKKGYHEHYQTIKIVNNEVPHAYENPLIEVNADDCGGGYVSIPELQVGGNDCNDGYKITNDSEFSSYSGADASGHYPVGMHTINYTVEYGCGSSKNFNQVIKVNNKIAPVPICVSGLSIALMPVDEDRDGTPEDGSVLIWAKDINFKSHSPCGLDLYYSFSADELVMSTEFTCANVGVNQLNVYVSDANGNQSYCRVEIFVQNNAANIPGCNANGLAEDAEEEENAAEEEADEEGENEADEEIYGEHETEDAEGDEPADGEADEEPEDPDAEYDEDHESVDTTVTPDPDSSDIAMIYGNLFSNHGEALSSSVMLEGDVEFAGQIEYESVLVTTIVDSFINDQGQKMYVTDFSYEDVPIEGSGQSVFSREAIANASGEYIINDIPLGQTVTIDPRITAAEYFSNISTADGIILFEHLTGINRIKDPHTLLAADIDGDFDIDFDDVEFLVDYIAGELSELPNKQWLFVDGDFVFQNSDSPWSEDYLTDELFINQAVYEMDFIGVQIGDLGDIDLENRTTIDDLRRQIDEYLGKTHTSNLRVSPNPFTNELNLDIKSELSEQTQLQLFDLSGKLLLKQNIQLTKGQNKVRINIDEQYTGTIIYRLNMSTHEYRGKLIRLR